MGDRGVTTRSGVSTMADVKLKDSKKQNSTKKDIVGKKSKSENNMEQSKIDIKNKKEDTAKSADNKTKISIGKDSHKTVEDMDSSVSDSDTVKSGIVTRTRHKMPSLSPKFERKSAETTTKTLAVFKELEIETRSSGSKSKEVKFFKSKSKIIGKSSQNSEYSVKKESSPYLSVYDNIDDDEHMDKSLKTKAGKGKLNSPYKCTNICNDRVNKQTDAKNKIFQKNCTKEVLDNDEKSSATIKIGGAWGSVRRKLDSNSSILGGKELQIDLANISAYKEPKSVGLKNKIPESTSSNLKNKPFSSGINVKKYKNKNMKSNIKDLEQEVKMEVQELDAESDSEAKICMEKSLKNGVCSSGTTAKRLKLNCNSAKLDKDLELEDNSELIPGNKTKKTSKVGMGPKDSDSGSKKDVKQPAKRGPKPKKFGNNSVKMDYKKTDTGQQIDSNRSQKDETSGQANKKLNAKSNATKPVAKGIKNVGLIKKEKKFKQNSESKIGKIIKPRKRNTDEAELESNKKVKKQKKIIISDSGGSGSGKDGAIPTRRRGMREASMNAKTFMRLMYENEVKPYESAADTNSHNMLPVRKNKIKDKLAKPEKSATLVKEAIKSKIDKVAVKKEPKPQKGDNKTAIIKKDLKIDTEKEEKKERKNTKLKKDDFLKDKSLTKKADDMEEVKPTVKVIESSHSDDQEGDNKTLTIGKGSLRKCLGIRSVGKLWDAGSSSDEFTYTDSSIIEDEKISKLPTGGTTGCVKKEIEDNENINEVKKFVFAVKKEELENAEILSRNSDSDEDSRGPFVLPGRRRNNSGAKDSSSDDSAAGGPNRLKRIRRESSNRANSNQSKIKNRRNSSVSDIDADDESDSSPYERSQPQQNYQKKRDTRFVRRRIAVRPIDSGSSSTNDAAGGGVIGSANDATRSDNKESEVRITDVFSRTSRSMRSERYCSISDNVQYRIMETEATAVTRETTVLHRKQDAVVKSGANSDKNPYAPLTALSNMNPPNSPHHERHKHHHYPTPSTSQRSPVPPPERASAFSSPVMYRAATVAHPVATASQSVFINSRQETSLIPSLYQPAGPMIHHRLIRSEVQTDPSASSSTGPMGAAMSIPTCSRESPFSRVAPRRSSPLTTTHHTVTSESHPLTPPVSIVTNRTSECSENGRSSSLTSAATNREEEYSSTDAFPVPRSSSPRPHSCDYDSNTYPSPPSTAPYVREGYAHGAIRHPMPPYQMMYSTPYPPAHHTFMPVALQHHRMPPQQMVVLPQSGNEPYGASYQSGENPRYIAAPYNSTQPSQPQPLITIIGAPNCLATYDHLHVAPCSKNGEFGPLTGIISSGPQQQREEVIQPYASRYYNNNNNMEGLEAEEDEDGHAEFGNYRDNSSDRSNSRNSNNPVDGSLSPPSNYFRNSQTINNSSPVDENARSVGINNYNQSQNDEDEDYNGVRRHNVRIVMSDDSGFNSPELTPPPLIPVYYQELVKALGYNNHPLDDEGVGGIVSVLDASGVPIHGQFHPTSVIPIMGLPAPNYVQLPSNRLMYNYNTDYLASGSNNYYQERQSVITDNGANHTNMSYTVDDCGGGLFRLRYFTTNTTITKLENQTTPDYGRPSDEYERGESSASETSDEPENLAAFQNYERNVHFHDKKSNAMNYNDSSEFVESTSGYSYEKRSLNSIPTDITDGNRHFSESEELVQDVAVEISDNEQYPIELNARVQNNPFLDVEEAHIMPEQNDLIYQCVRNGNNRNDTSEFSNNAPNLSTNVKKKKSCNQGISGRANCGQNVSIRPLTSSEPYLAMFPLPKRRKRKPKWSRGWKWLGRPFVRRVFIDCDGNEDFRVCYNGMKHDAGDILRPNDCVMLKAGNRKSELAYVAKIAYMWENSEDEEMMISLFWYYRPEHTVQGRKPFDHSQELFASRHRDVNSVACIDDKCYVLTFNEYNRFYKDMKHKQEDITPTIPMVAPLKIIANIDQNDGTEIEIRDRLPSKDISPELVFFCRKIYDIDKKRLLNNPLL